MAEGHRSMSRMVRACSMAESLALLSGSMATLTSFTPGQQNNGAASKLLLSSSNLLKIT
jgi:hypothetical protein